MPSRAAFQAERSTSHEHAPVHGRSFARLNCAGLRDDAPYEVDGLELNYHLRSPKLKDASTTE